LKDAFEQAKDQAGENKDEEAIDTATGALDKAEQQFQGAMEKLENMGQTNQEIQDKLDDAQNAISGQKPNQDQQQGPSESDKKEEGDQSQQPSEDQQQGQQGEGEQKPEENPEGDGESDEQTPPQDENTSSGGSGEEKKDTDAFIPGLGDATLEELIKNGAFDGEYDKQFGRDLTDEERQAIENYFQSLKGNG
jgi:hypothetical protein